MDELLFHRGDLNASLEAQGTKMRAAVECEPDESLMQADADEWAAALAHHFAVACPVLKRNEVWMEPPQEVGVDVSRDPGRYFSDYASDLARQFPGNRIVVHVPFEGDAGVFELKTSSWTTTKPRGLVQGSDLLLTIESAHDAEPNLSGRVALFMDEVDRYLGWAREQIDRFNAGLAHEARQAIDARRRRLQQRDAHIAASGIPVRHPGETGKTYLADVIVRRPAPSLPENRADEEPPELEPALEAKVYEHILDVMRMHGRQMEQNPGAYAQLGEEDRRQQILATVNTHYQGRAAAEAFNHQGKTDILIRFEGRNLFICECKFWEGPAGFQATIDQLFRYVGWRDTKLAIVMFVREKGLTTILKRARATLGKHEQFVSWGSSASETELRTTMHWPDDEERLVDLNVFFVHTPLPRAAAL